MTFNHLLLQKSLIYLQLKIYIFFSFFLSFKRARLEQTFQHDVMPLKMLEEETTCLKNK